jgi:hypothetical protein
MSHPYFVYQSGSERKPFKLTSGSLVSSEELAIHLSFPQQSIPGLLVKNHASFARNVWAEKECTKPIELGKIYHLGKEEAANVVLDSDALTGHTFITGNVGTGKTNTVFCILESLRKLDNPINFLVIEPVKGEYKNLFGSGVNVFGTDADITPLLKINPFVFPNNIKVKNHIDNLVEILCTCWPMYAGMPAALKTAIQNAYCSCGWNVNKSKNPFGLYPSISDVVEELKIYINSSNFSSDTKGDYEGALLTRLDSLRGGVLGNVITYEAAIDDEKLFNQSTIIDLSSVKSSESLSLIMALLIMKLDEFRSSERKGMNLPLRHVTVLEEAHNLLKRTSTQQIAESSNVMGKAVEMLSKCIREMRSYGEGFIIADQTPEQLDISAISATNTKILMCLPNMNDCEIAGKSIGLNDMQIEEIANLSTGIAIVKQRGWQSPVLCKINHIPTEGRFYDYENKETEEDSNEYSLYTALVKSCVNDENISYDEFHKLIFSSNTSSCLKHKILNKCREMGYSEISPLDCAECIALLFGEKTIQEANIFNSPQDFKRCVRHGLFKANKELYNLFELDEKAIETYLKGIYSIYPEHIK